MKKIVLLTMMYILTGCSATSINRPTKLDVYLRSNDYKAGRTKYLYMIKSNDLISQYCPEDIEVKGIHEFWSNRCSFLSTDKDLPEKIEFIYTKWLSLDDQDKHFNRKDVLTRDFYTDGNFDIDAYDKAFIAQNKIYAKQNDEALLKIPPEQWKTFTLYPKKIFARYKNIQPQGEPPNNFDNRLSFSRDKIIDFRVYVDEHGNITTDEKYRWIKKGQEWRN